MAYVIVEYEFNPPVTKEQLEHMASVLAPCVSMRRIRKLRSIIALDRRRGYCEFEAPDVETVREAFRSAHVPFRSVWGADLFEAGPPSI